MKNFVIITTGFFAILGCSHTQNATIHSFQRNEVKARITFYSSDPKWGTQVACPNTDRAIEGVTVAAHPDFDFGTVVEIPELEEVLGNRFFVVQDRGSAVTAKKASKGKEYVFDVFVQSRKKLAKLAKSLPEYMEVIIK